MTPLEHRVVPDPKPVDTAVGSCPDACVPPGHPGASECFKVCFTIERKPVHYNQEAKLSEGARCNAENSNSWGAGPVTEGAGDIHRRR